jgi:predicted nucleic acid-binding protein
MPADLICWDADVFLSYLDASQRDRWPVLDALLAESARRDGALRVVTSVLAMSEVAFTAQERLGRVLEDVEEARIDALWTAGGPAEVLDFHPGVARRARALVRGAMQEGLRLRPADSIHLATAIEAGVREFHTYNLEDYRNFARIAGFPIVSPRMPAGP